MALDKQEWDKLLEDLGLTLPGGQSSDEEDTAEVEEKAEEKPHNWQPQQQPQQQQHQQQYTGNPGMLPLQQQPFLPPPWAPLPPQPTGGGAPFPDAL